jgi:hypothetical protein
MKNRGLPEFWTARDARDAENASCYSSLSKVALRVARRQRKYWSAKGNPHLAVVSGTISNGGVLSHAEILSNLRLFAKAIRELKSLGIPVWEQLPFESHLFRIRKSEGLRHEPMELLERFYLPIFGSGYITMVFLLPNWKQSHGARWEKKIASGIGGITLFYIR